MILLERASQILNIAWPGLIAPLGAVLAAGMVKIMIVSIYHAWREKP